VLAADNVWFSLLTQNSNPIHFDYAYAAQTEFGRPLVESTLTLAIVTGQSVSDISENALANLGWDEIRLPNPVFEGDTIYSTSEVLEKRESKSRPYAGIVTFRTTGYKQDGTVVIEFKRTILVYRKGHLPERARVQPRR
jgi:acyl dehydratase